MAKESEPLILREIRTEEDLQAVQEIRRCVLEDEQGWPHDVNVDGLDDQGVHLLASRGGTAIATARLVVAPNAVGMIARIAILPKHRGQGLATQMLERLESIARQRNVSTLEVEPHQHLQPLFQRLGYQPTKTRRFLQFELVRMTKSL